MIFVEKLLSGLKRLNRPPRYSAPHQVTGIRGSDGAKEWLEPEAVWGNSGHYPVKGKVHIRPVPEAYADDLAAIDAERLQLNRRLAELRTLEAQVLELAWHASKPLTVAEVKAFTVEKTTA